MELLTDDETRWAWCLVATIDPDATGKGARVFQPGSVVYCFPPTIGGAYQSVKVIGRSAKSGRWTSAVVSAGELKNWKAQRITDAAVLEQIAPPWDAGDTSCEVARGIAAWTAGGPWPVGPVREWNRLNAEKHVGRPPLIRRLGSGISKLLGRE